MDSSLHMHVASFKVQDQIRHASAAISRCGAPRSMTTAHADHDRGVARARGLALASATPAWRTRAPPFVRSLVMVTDRRLIEGVHPNEVPRTPPPAGERGCSAYRGGRPEEPRRELSR